MRRLLTLVVGAALPLLLWAALPVASEGSGERSATIRSRIATTESRIEHTRGKERVLTTDIAGFTARIDALQGRITTLERREAAAQADLDRKRAQLARLARQLDRVQVRLARLRAHLARARRILARRLVELYKSDQPDVISVVLNAHSFADLLDNGEFLSRIGTQDRQIITAVRRSKAQATTTARRLGVLVRRQRRLEDAIRARRDELAAVRGQLVAARAGYARQRDRKAAALAATQESRHRLEGNLSALRAAQARILAAIQAAQRRAAARAAASSGSSTSPVTNPSVAGPAPQGSGRLIWPVNGPITSPFCERRAWEACHPGIDIGVPTGTPIRAAGSGRVIIAGSEGGYGNYTCIQHAGSLSTCYAHQSQVSVAVGQTVSQGQVIGLSGCTGLCFGPHLHFEVRVNGGVVNPLNYL